jgi:hypothetical protein
VISHQILFGSLNLKNEIRKAWVLWNVWRGAYRVLVEKPRGKKHLEDLGIDGRIILIWTFKI